VAARSSRSSRLMLVLQDRLGESALILSRQRPDTSTHYRSSRYELRQEDTRAALLAPGGDGGRAHLLAPCEVDDEMIPVELD